MSLPFPACFILLWVILVLQHLICTKAAPVVPFSVPYDPAAVSDLAGKLSKIRYPHEVDGGGEDWYPGAPVEVVQRLVEHWQNNFDWSAQVAKLNEMPQFTMQLGEHNVHFVHQRSSNQNATALLLIHGWPGSFWECSKILPLLTEPQLHGGRAEDAFHVVCPSIPGFGYSSKPTRPGFDQMECAKVFATLMHELDYVEYYLQGGDWGSVVASLQAVLPPGPARGKVLGLHLNMVPAPPPVMKGPVAVANLMLSVVLPSWYYSPQEWKDIKETPLRSLLQTGYFHQQSTKPSTTAYGLSDSPVGLMAWIVEKFYEWSDCHGDVFSRFTEDELLTNVMIYWMTNSAASSVRFYYELVNGPNTCLEALFAKLEVQVPAAMALFPVELFAPVKYWAGHTYKNIVQWNHMPTGGHFAAMEEPVLLAKDLWQFKMKTMKSNSQTLKSTLL